MIGQNVPRVQPFYVDLHDETRLLQPGKISGSKVSCRVFFDESKGKRPPVYQGKTLLPRKMFDDGTSDIPNASQRSGFLIKS